jgi:hypothetical protein
LIPILISTARNNTPRYIREENMTKAIFFEEAYKKGLMSEITDGYILSITTPDVEDVQKKLDPFRLEMVNFSGLKSILPLNNGVKFQAQGKKMYTLIEPANFPRKYEEPALRPTGSTSHMPFRFDECETFFTRDYNYRVVIPHQPYDCHDSFTIEFPMKGDLCILYEIFDSDIEGKVVPFIQDNFTLVLKDSLRLRKADAKVIVEKFMSVVKTFAVKAA